MDARSAQDELPQLAPTRHDHDHHHPETEAGPPRAHDADALIGARSLWLTRSGRAILQGVDIDISRGEILTLIGPNGAGKTTLVRVLLGLEPPDQGTIQRKPGLIVGYVPQRFEVDRAIPLTVARFVELGRRAEPEEIARVLGDVGAEKLADRQLAELSGGELQRVVLARALVGSPGILVLDGTWSQAKALWWRNAWMLKCQRIILGPKRPSLYGKLRKEPRADGLSTIEAAGMTIARLEGRPDIETALNDTFARLLAQYREVQTTMPELAPKPRPKRDYRKPEKRRGKSARTA